MNFLHFIGVHKGRELMKPKVKPILEDLSWAEIKAISDSGQAANYFSIGDTKSITLNGTIGTLELNNYTTYVYIIDFNHNSEVEGTGISFSGFRSETSGKDIAFYDSRYNGSPIDNTKWFSFNHSTTATTVGGWKDCDLRYDILGSVEAKGQQNATSVAITNPVENTLMAALPSDLRAVLRPVTKWTDNVGNSSVSVEENVTPTIDYLFLLSEKEASGSTRLSNEYEGSHQTQYTYYISSLVKYKYNDENAGCSWWMRSPSSAIYEVGFCRVAMNGTFNASNSNVSSGLSPVFVV